MQMDDKALFCGHIISRKKDREIFKREKSHNEILNQKREMRYTKSMLYPGARDETAKQINKALCYNYPNKLISRN